MMGCGLRVRRFRLWSWDIDITDRTYEYTCIVQYNVIQYSRIQYNMKLYYILYYISV